MPGDVLDFVRRMLVVLPGRWFCDPALPTQTPTLLQALLSGFGTAWALVYMLITNVQLLARLATVYGPFLDMASADFFGNELPRRLLETDAQFRLRVQQELFRPRGTRAAIARTLTELTGTAPRIFEPARPADTGGYTTGGIGYCVAGGWGNLTLRYASFVVATRPLGSGIAQFAGYGTGGYLYYGDLSMVARPVSDTDIFASAAAVLPAGYMAWMRIQD